MPWVATNMDWSIPVERGIAPGNGTLVAAVHQAVSRMPVVAGKPERPIFDAALARFGGERPLFIGDRLDTDIKGANDVGHPERARADRHRPAEAGARGRPALAADLRAQGPPRTVTSPTRYTIRSEDPDGTRRVTVGESTVSMRGHVVRAEHVGSDEMDLLRAGATAIWDSGLAIYGLDVDPALYGGE